jgi:hypothetical protein
MLSQQQATVLLASRTDAMKVRCKETQRKNKDVVQLGWQWGTSSGDPSSSKPE